MRRGWLGRVLALGAVLSLAAIAPGTGAAAVGRNAPSGARAANAASAGAGSPGALSTRIPRRASKLSSGVSLTPTRRKPYWACPEEACTAIVDPVTRTSSRRWALPEGGRLLEGSGQLGGYDPQDLRSAYKIPEEGGSTQTVAVVDAFGDATAESDLAAYRNEYHLGTCTKASGCFSKVNQNGEEANYPGANKGWEGETSLDLDMVSAACPHCHILLVQATSASVLNLAESENTAARLGAGEISNSYGVAEELCGAGHCEEFSSYYNHPGKLIVASSGDRGYDNDYEHDASPSFPATLPSVLAVGGTSLHKASGARGWSEAVWNEPSRELGTGSGCSLSEAKPAWQKDKGCAKRADNDVAAVAACETPLSVYSTAYGGWEDFCGTSASAPLTTGILANASEHTRSLGARAFYEDPGSLFPVTKGNNGTCTVEYLCNAEKSESGYNGPTGLGTPDALPQPPMVSAVLPAAGFPLGGISVKITGTNLAGASAVKFGQASATSFKVESESAITAVSPPGQGTLDVTVTTPDGVSAVSSADQFSYFIPALYQIEGLPYKVPVEAGKALTFAIPSQGQTFALGPVTVGGSVGEHAKLELHANAAFEAREVLHYVATGQGIVSSATGYNARGEAIIGPLTIACTPPASAMIGEIPIGSSPIETRKQYSASFEAECVLAPGVLDERTKVAVTAKASAPEGVTPGEQVQVSEASFAIIAPVEWREELLAIGAREVSGRSASDATATLHP